MNTSKSDFENDKDLGNNENLSNEAISKLLAERTKAEMQVLARNQSASLQLHSDKIDKLHSEIDKFYNKLLSLEFTVHNISNRTPPGSSGAAKKGEAQVNAFNTEHLDRLESIEKKLSETVEKNIELTKFNESIKEQLASPSNIAIHSESESAYIEKIRTLENIVHNTTQASQESSIQINELQNRLKEIHNRLDEDERRRNSGTLPSNFDDLAQQATKNATSIQRIENTIGLDKAHLENKITQLREGNKYGKLLLWSNVALWACMLPLAAKYLFFDKKVNTEEVKPIPSIISNDTNTLSTKPINNTKTSKEEVTNRTDLVKAENNETDANNKLENTTDNTTGSSFTDNEAVEKETNPKEDLNKNDIPNNVIPTVPAVTKQYDSKVSRRTNRKPIRSNYSSSAKVVRTYRNKASKKNIRVNVYNSANQHRKATVKNKITIQNTYSEIRNVATQQKDSNTKSNNNASKNNSKGVYFGED